MASELIRDRVERVVDHIEDFAGEKMSKDNLRRLAGPIVNVFSDKAGPTRPKLLELPIDEREKYVHSLLPVVVGGDRVTGPLLSNLYRLFATTELPSEARLKLLDQVFLRKTGASEVEWSFGSPEVKTSLAKDALAFGVDGNSARLNAVNELINRLGISPAQVDFLKQWIAWENRVLEKIGRGEAVVSEDSPTELLSRGAAIGIPLAALYFSGIVGFSAAGITSGLAWIGSTSLLVFLGLNPMTAGIAALIVAGVSIKKILDSVLTNAPAERKKVEASLETMKAAHRRYVDYLQDDCSRLESLNGHGRIRKNEIALLKGLLAEGSPREYSAKGRTDHSARQVDRTKRKRRS